jgi:hypothetical protein
MTNAARPGRRFALGALRMARCRPPPGRHHRSTSPETAGGGWVGQGAVRFVRGCEMVGRPPPRPPSTNCVGEVRRTFGDAIEFSPFSRAAGERGPLGRSFDVRRRAPKPAVRLPSAYRPSPGDRSRPSPRGTSGVGPGEGHPVGRQFDALRSSRILPEPPRPPPTSSPAGRAGGCRGAGCPSPASAPARRRGEKRSSPRRGSRTA